MFYRFFNNLEECRRLGVPTFEGHVDMLSSASFALIGCRLIAIYHLSFGLKTAITWFSQGITLSYLQPAVESADISAQWVRSAQYFTVSITMFVVLWLASRWISEQIIRNNQVESEKNDWTYLNIMTVMVSIIGLYLIVSNAPDILKYLYTNGFSMRGFGFYVYRTFEMIVGLVCVLGSRWIAGLITGNRCQSQTNAT